MLVLDTDHLTEFQKGTSPEALRLKQHLDDSIDWIRLLKPSLVALVTWWRK